ncbi:conjugal transfer transcriptional regulator TraJ [Pseudoduganella buxea]|uniref:Conjugal transfer transcriptional regulator TraJ n=1 Tax=Pseudoduganella buxea TaxID=1949069 RepID=A0A6I3SQV0_9BURK|nr:conjugal transfer transcriptional regulator TraJ [Pseudoduganella buxea]MTV51441.1 conjugal transfer transcriptional regulator TraJ [Pseudoduganella buxea]GGC10267.1 OriT-binding protein, TraJ [Pseudoduganella buxea]
MKDKALKLTHRHKHLRVPVLPQEAEQIASNARAANLPIAVFLRNVGQGYQARSILDNRRVEELARINGDLGRLGGLLKLWLTNDVRTAAFSEATIRALLSKIASTQDQMQSIMREVLIPKK